MLAMIDAGGTTFKCGLATNQGDLLEKFRVDTLDPSTTIKRCRAEFDRLASAHRQTIARLGVAAFGPLDVDPQSHSYGTILNTPKAGWAGFNLKAALESELGAPVVLDTDVNAALLGEVSSGAAKGTRRAAYVTVGTGIGVSFIQDGQLIAKPLHPEFGHIPVNRHADDSYSGACPFHVDCLEGMASAKAFEARWGPADSVARDHHGWEFEADYLAQLCLSIALLLRPEKIILGGGLLLAPELLGKVKHRFAVRLNGYLGKFSSDPDELIVRPRHGDDAGLMGALSLILSGLN